jgi:chaperonin cofactor prefoldin
MNEVVTVIADSQQATDKRINTLIESQAHTDKQLDALIDIVREGRNGNS